MTATNDQVSSFSATLPPLADWLAGISQLSIKDKRKAASGVLPAVQLAADDVRDQWHAAIVDAGIWATATLERKAAALPAAPARPGAAEKPAGRPSRERGEIQIQGGAWSYTPGAGMWDDRGNQVLKWTPEVVDHYATYNMDGEYVRGRVRVTVGRHTHTVSLSDVKTGKAWDQFPDAAGIADNRTRDQLANLVKTLASELDETPGHPAWIGGRLKVPPSHVIGRGYMEQGGTREGYIELLRETARAPKMAFVVSMALAGVYVLPLHLDSFLVHMNDDSSNGKSSTYDAAAAGFGNPAKGKLRRSWDVSAKALTYGAQSMRCFTLFRDELETAGDLLHHNKLGRAIMNLMEGGIREVANVDLEVRPVLSGWLGGMISSGNISAVEHYSNTRAIRARVIEISGPYTLDGPHADRCKDLARDNYGWLLPDVMERGPDADEYRRRWIKAETEFGLGGQGVLGRVAKHCAGAIAAAQIIADLYGIPEYPEVVKAACWETLTELRADLGEIGESADREFRLFLASLVLSRPAQFPKLNAAGDVMPGSDGVWGYDITDSVSYEGDIAILTLGMSRIFEVYPLHDRTTVLRSLDKTGNLHRNATRRKEGKRAGLVRVNGKSVQAYQIDRVFSAAEEEADSGLPVWQTPTPEEAARGAVSPRNPSCNPSRNPSCNPDGTHSDQGRNPVTRKSPDMTHTRDDDDDDDALLAIVNDPASDESAIDAALAELDRRFLAFQEAAKQLLPAPEGKETDQGANASQSEAQPQKSATPKGCSPEAAKPRRNPSTTATSAKTDAEEAENWAKWLAKPQTADWLAAKGIEVDENLARRALAAWHAATVPTSDGTSGVRWSVSAGRTGLYAFRMLLEIHKNKMKSPAWEESEIVTEYTESDLLLTVNFANPNIDPETCISVTSADVNKQFLSNARAVNLGDGDPQIVNRPRTTTDLLKMPGWVELAKDAKIDHYAFPEGVIRAGTRIVMPLALYLDQRGVDLRLSQAVVWPQDRSGTRLAPHADLLKKALVKLGEWKQVARDDQQRHAAMIAEAAVKHVYSVDYGGLLRSKVNGFELYRRDWSDQLVGLSWANALRNVDRAAYDCGPVDGKAMLFSSVKPNIPTVSQHIRAGGALVHPPLAMCKDTAFWAHDNENAWLPPALEVSDTQPGKFGPDKHVAMTPRLARAISEATPYGIRDAVNEAAKENGK